MSQPGYKYLRSYQLTVIIYDLTVEFCRLWIKSFRTSSQMEQASRSGKQNISEGYLENSLKSYIYLLGVAYASLGELLEDFEDYLRQNNLNLWDQTHPKIREFRDFRVEWTSPNTLNSPTLPKDPEEAANLMITLIHQAQFLLSRQIESLKDKFVKEGGFTENLFKKRMEYRSKKL
jgi:restriction system protein